MNDAIEWEKFGLINTDPVKLADEYGLNYSEYTLPELLNACVAIEYENYFK